MFEDIEKRRIDEAVSQRDLCAAADVHPTTYSAIKSGRSGGNASTLKKLNAALDALIASREAAE